MSRIGDDHLTTARGRDRSRACTGAASSATSSAAPPSSPRPTSRLAGPASGAVPSAAQVAELYDLEDLQTDAAAPTSELITITINQDGTASFALPRMEVGQGITTSTAMIIAEELDLPVEQVRRHAGTRTPRAGDEPADRRLQHHGVDVHPDPGRRRDRPRRAAGRRRRRARLRRGPAHQQAGGRHGARRELPHVRRARDRGGQRRRRPGPGPAQGPRRLHGHRDPAQPGRRPASPSPGARSSPWTSTCPGALPTMVCRPPTLNGSPRSLDNEARSWRCRASPTSPWSTTGVAVRAETFGQCIDAIRAMSVDWNPGSVEGESDSTILARLRKAELPLAVPDVPLLAQTVEKTSRSCSAAAPPSSPTARSPTSAPTRPRSGPA